MRQIKKYELELISHLRKDARQSLTDLGRKMGMPISTIYDRLKSQEKTIIKKFTAIVDFQRLGFQSRAKMILKVRRDEKEELKNALLSHENVNSRWKINNGYDFMIDCIFRNIVELEEFISFLEETYRVRGINVYYLIDNLMQENFFSEEGSIEKMMLAVDQSSL